MELRLILILSPIIIKVIFALIKWILSVLYWTTSLFSKDTRDIFSETYKKAKKFVKEDPFRAILWLIVILAVLYGTYRLFLYNPIVAGLVLLFWIWIAI